MRLHADFSLKYYGPMQVLDCPSMRLLSGVIWVDEETAQYGTHIVPFVAVGNTLLTKVEQVKKIKILLSQKLILIDPIEDVDLEGLASELNLSVPQ